MILQIGPSPSPTKIKVGPDYETLRLVDGKFERVYIVDTPASGRARRNVRAQSEVYPFFVMSELRMLDFSREYDLMNDRGAWNQMNKRTLARGARDVVHADLVGVTNDHYLFFYSSEETLVECKLRYL